jgi:hypothetical protein
MISGAFGRGSFERDGLAAFAAALPGASFARDGATRAGSFAPFALVTRRDLQQRRQ